MSERTFFLGKPRQHYHRIQYPDGTVHDGRVDHRGNAKRLGIQTLEGLRVLDIATNDGFFAFWAEQKGAAEVVAIDVGNYKEYDWGFDGPPVGIEDFRQQDKWQTFDFHHRNLNSRVVKKVMSVYDIDSLGQFDVVLNFGLIYHLRNPVLALDKCRAVCRGFCVVESATLKISPYLPASLEGGAWTGLGSQTDFNFPTTACLASWMKKACFPDVFIQPQIIPERTTVVGVVDPNYLGWFGHMAKCDEQYWNVVRKTTKKLTGSQE